MKGGRLTKPSATDNEFMVVTCTPDKTAVEFHEFQDQALDAARANLHPSTSTYLGKVTHQGEHQVRGSAKYVAVLVEVDPELREALAYYHDAPRPARAVVHGWLQGILDRHLGVIRSDYRAAKGGALGRPAQMAAAHVSTDDEKTHPGVSPPSPMERIRRLAQPAIDRANQAVDLAAAAVLPDPTPPPWWCGTPCSSRASTDPKCHPGDKCDNHPACESCGPARL